jgi:hypothetical protein
MVARSPHRPDPDGLTVTLIVFDALAIAGTDLRASAWSQRRAQLEEFLAGATGAVRPTPVLELNPALHAALIVDGWEGTVATRTSGRYRCGHRSSSWVNLKSPASRDRDRRRALARIDASPTTRRHLLVHRAIAVSRGGARPGGRPGPADAPSVGAQRESVMPAPCIGRRERGAWPGRGGAGHAARIRRCWDQPPPPARQRSCKRRRSPGGR